jgi:hypothetical protein
MLLLLAMLVSACSSIGSPHDSPDYYRHTLSQLSTPPEGGDYYWFDVKLTPEYPDESEGAEEVRMEWLSAWLANRKTCPNGYEIVERREFDYMEHNAGRYDLRYKVRCAVPGSKKSG